MNFEDLHAERYRQASVILHNTHTQTLAVRAHDLRTNQTVFLKAKDSGADSLGREAEVLHDLSHPQIPRLYEARLEEEIPYIVTEYMGSSRYAREWMDRYPTPAAVARLCFGALEPLRYLHEQGIMHRDIKPHNFIFRLAGGAALVDFGASLPETVIDPGNKLGRVVGTVEYIAPERATGQPHDRRADIYSMGIVMYELLSGAAPFNGESPQEIAMKHLAHDPDFSTAYWLSAPSQLVSIIDRATRKRPEERYADAADMQEDITRFLETAR